MHSRNLARGTRWSKKGNARVRSVCLSDLAWNKLDSWAAAQGLGLAEALEHWAQEPPCNGAKIGANSFPQPMHGQVQASNAESNKNLNSLQSEINDKLLVERSGELEQLNRALEERIFDLQITHHQLRESERRFEAVFEAAAVGMVIATPDGVFTRVNKALESFLGCEPGELVGRTFQDITHPDDFEVGLPYRERLLAGEIEAYQLQKRYIRKDRTCAWGQLSLSLVHSETGAPLHFVGLIEDIDARAVAESLRRNLEEKELLLREIHHRVKNNLQVVASLLGLQALKLSNTAAAEALTDSQQRINSIALVHEHLYRSEGLAGVEFYPYLEQLTQMLFASHGELAKRVCLELDVEAAMLDIDCAVPLGLVVNELVSNALKHAFPNDRTGQVRVELKATASGGWRLVVEDDGIGFAPQTSSTPITLGIKLLRSLARQLDAKVSWQGLPKGTRCEIQFSSCPSQSNEL